MPDPDASPLVRRAAALAATITLAAALLCPLLPARASEIDRELFNPIIGSIVKVEVTTESGAYSLGSALSVAPGIFATSCHVTAQAASITMIYQGLRWRATRQRANTERDLCLLRVPGLDDVQPLARRSSRDLHVEDDVAALGYTFGQGLSVQGGTVRSLHAVAGGVVIQSATYFNSGASGGGLFTLDGRLAGILTFRLKGAEAYYFSIPADWIDEELARSDAFLPIGVLDGPRPFWAQPPEKLPFFMRASTLEARGLWTELAELTRDWADAEPRSAEPWFMRGQALTRLDQGDAALDAYRHAITLQPDDAQAWFELGKLQLSRGQADDVRQTLTTLGKLDVELAMKLASSERSAAKPTVESKP